MADDNKLDYIQERVDTLVDRTHENGKAIEGLRASFDHHVATDEKMYEELSRMNNTLDRNTASLEVHMRRTDLLETYVKDIEKRFSPLELEQVRKAAVAAWWSAKAILVGKIAGLVSAGGALWLAAKQLIQFMAN